MRKLRRVCLLLYGLWLLLDISAYTLDAVSNAAQVSCNRASGSSWEQTCCRIRAWADPLVSAQVF